MTILEIDYAKCLVTLNPTAEWAINGNDYDSLQWFSDSPKPTEEEIIAIWPQAKAAFEAKIEAQLQARKTAESKLEALGLTISELKALGL